MVATEPPSPKKEELPEQDMVVLTQTLYDQGLLGTCCKSAGFSLSTLYLSELLKCFFCRVWGLSVSVRAAQK